MNFREELLKQLSLSYWSLRSNMLEKYTKENEVMHEVKKRFKKCVKILSKSNSELLAESVVIRENLLSSSYHHLLYHHFFSFSNF